MFLVGKYNQTGRLTGGLVASAGWSRAIACLAIVLALGSCAGGGSKGAPGQNNTRSFPSCEVPGAYAADPQGAYEYLAEHFWDAYTDTSAVWLCDSVHVGGVLTEDLEQAFANYAGVLENVDFKVAKKAVSRLYDRVLACEMADTSSNVFETVTSLAERYLYDANSPLRNEDLYAAYAERLAQCPLISPWKQDVYAYDVRMCSLNSIGTVAADFVFCDAAGRRRTLHSIDAQYILLFFSNPGCHACEDIIRTLSETLSVDALIADGTLAVLNIYIDEDRAAWYEYMSIYPESWYNAYDPAGIIRGDTLYNVRAIPSLYLLDSGKRVIMKDAPEQRIFNFIQAISGQS